MRASRNSRGRARGAALVAAAALVSWTAAAQPVGPPIPLVPPSAAPGEAPHRPPIASHELTPPAAGWSGEVAPAAEALPRDFWDGTPRGLAELLLAHQPETTSPALQSLQRRLLLSPAAAPIGPDAPGLQLPVLRAAGLLRLGEVEAARAVIAAMPEATRGPALPFAVAADAITGSIEGACAKVRELIRREPNVRWQTALIACQALSGKLDEARLGLQLLAEEKAPRGEAVRIAVDALAGLPSPDIVERLQPAEPLTVRLVVAAHRRLAPAVIEGLPAELALTLARDSAAPAAVRLAAATRAARLGALPPERLRALYAELGNAAAADGGPAQQEARRFATIGQAGTAVDRLARIVGFADRLGKAGAGGYIFAARLVAPLLREIEPDPSLAATAAAAARLMLAAGDMSAARRWAAFVSGPEGEKLQFLLRLATGDVATAAATGLRQLKTLPLVLALDEALGYPIASADWLRLPEAMWSAAPAAPVRPAARLDLAAAARARRVGETALATVLVAAPPETLASDPVVLNLAVSSLMRVGLGWDARRLAVEAALAAGL